MQTTRAYLDTPLLIISLQYCARCLNLQDPDNLKRDYVKIIITMVTSTSCLMTKNTSYPCPSHYTLAHIRIGLDIVDHITMFTVHLMIEVFAASKLHC